MQQNYYSYVLPLMVVQCRKRSKNLSGKRMARARLSTIEMVFAGVILVLVMVIIYVVFLQKWFNAQSQPSGTGENSILDLSDSDEEEGSEPGDERDRHNGLGSRTITIIAHPYHRS